MKKLFFILSFVLIASACATRRQSNNHLSVQEVSKETIETVRNESTQSSGVTTTEKDESTETQIHIIRYDTSLPVDLVTGKPPIREEEFSVSGRKANEKTKAEQEKQTDVSQSGKQTNESQINSTNDEKSNISADAVGGSNFVWVWIAGILFACVLIYFILKK